MAVGPFKFGGRFEFELDLVGFPLSRCHVTVFGLNVEIPAEWGRYMAVMLFELRDI